MSNEASREKIIVETRTRTIDECDTCSAGYWPVATVVIGPTLENHRRACQRCAEFWQSVGNTVLWDDSENNPQHEVSQPQGETP